MPLIVCVCVDIHFKVTFRNCNVEICRKASINRDVSLSVRQSVCVYVCGLCVYVCVCVSLGVLCQTAPACPSVALGALCCVHVDHLELSQVTAAAARLLANHHLESTTQPVSSRCRDNNNNKKIIQTSHNTRHRSCCAAC